MSDKDVPLLSPIPGATCENPHETAGGDAGCGVRALGRDYLSRPRAAVIGTAEWNTPHR
ncbi:hypothetical protein GCM10023214_33400 [Amycolatopsis dongchuanensis]|uniref:Uncharacterized protein n=1 Tax=Amycolatopsis dongchuanensis TaxID=1070866 RepID=A0ABP9QMG7_9PSEU